MRVADRRFGDIVIAFPWWEMNVLWEYELPQRGVVGSSS